MKERLLNQVANTSESPPPKKKLNFFLKHISFRLLYEDAESMSLLIKGVTAEDAGAYEICAANEMGMDTQQMNLIVKSKYFSKF